MKIKLQYIAPVLLTVSIIAPTAAFAASKPTCSLDVVTQNGLHWPQYKGVTYVLAQPGQSITVSWNSTDATLAMNATGMIPTQGQQVIGPGNTTTYSYWFASPQGTAICYITAVVLGSTSVTDAGVSSTVYVPPAPAATTTSNTTVAATSTNPFAVSMVPLLSGGSITPGQSVPVAYLQLQNLGSTQTTLPGVWLVQHGSQPTSDIIGFTTVDDKQLQRGGIGGMEGAKLFAADNTVFVPLNATFAPNQIRIYTIKAQLSHNVRTAGGTVSLDVSGISTTGAVTGSFPVRGVTWVVKTY